MIEDKMVYQIGKAVYKVSPKAFYSMKKMYATRVAEKQINAATLDNVKPPNGITLEVTVICNLRCSMCWWWGENGIAFRLVKERDPLVTNELSTQEIFALVDQVSKYTKEIYLAGGEPFIRKDLIQIIKYITGKGMSASLTSNGTLISDEQIKELSQIDNLMMTFSLDGTREVHDKIRGNGNFDRTVNTIKKLVAARGSRKFPILKTNTTFSPWLLGQTVELAKFLETLGMDGIHFQHLWFTSEEKAQQNQKFLKSIFDIEDTGAASHIISTPEQMYVEKLADEIAEMERMRFKTPIFIRPQMTREQIKKYYTDLNFSMKKRCIAPWTGMLIKANGDAMFCPDEWLTKYKLGNIREQSIDQLWYGDKAKKFREELYKFGLFPACARCCAIN